MSKITPSIAKILLIVVVLSWFEGNKTAGIRIRNVLSEGQASLHSYLLAGSRLDLTFFSSCSLSELLASSSSSSSSSFESSSFQVLLSTQKYQSFTYWASNSFKPLPYRNAASQSVPPNTHHKDSLKWFSEMYFNCNLMYCTV